MAYVKLAPFAVFLLAAFVMFPMKKVEGDGCQPIACGTFLGGCDDGCECLYMQCYMGMCMGGCGYENVLGGNFQRMVEEHPKSCLSHYECTKKGSGNYCAHFPGFKYGFCFASVSEAEDAYRMASGSKFKKDFLKMSLPA